MFCVGDTVLYGSQGVFKIVGTDEKNLDGNKILYFVLKPVYDENSTVFVPLSNNNLISKMRPLLSEEKILETINEFSDGDVIWIDDDNERKEEYQKIIIEGDRKKLIGLIRTICARRARQNKRGRKLHQTDDLILKQAEKLIYDEFAFVLNLKQDEVSSFITDHIDVQKKGA